MKLGICLALFAIASFVTSQVAYDPNFLVLANSWTVSATVPANLAGAACCVPGGSISFIRHKYSPDNVSLAATQWNGDLCNELGLSPDYYMLFPFNDTASYNELATNANQWTDVNGETVILNIGNYSDINGVLSWSLSMNFETIIFGGEICSAILTASNSVLVNSSVSAQPANEPNFLISYPWEVSATVPTNLAGADCCAPGGFIYFNKHKYNASSVSLNATEWNGDLCSYLGLTPDYDLVFPFNDTSSYNELVTNANQSTDVNGDIVILNIGNYSNTNGVLSWSLSFNFENTTFEGGICSVTLTTPNSTLTAA